MISMILTKEAIFFSNLFQCSFKDMRDSEYVIVSSEKIDLNRLAMGAF